ncbi:MAG TPA: hypothetical protein VIV11_39160 [Kofleriaceae bacterium]
MILTAVGAAACAADPPHVGEVQSEALVRCAAPSVYFKFNPQDDECRSSTLAGVNGFNFYFSSADVASQDLHIYYFDATSAEFFTVEPPSLSNVVSFHTQWDDERITRAYWASASGATEEVAVPADMVGAHHASTNHSDPTAFWSDAAGNSEPVSIARMHSCTYLRTR